MTGVSGIFSTRETAASVCKEMCENKSESHGCRGFNHHRSLGCYFHRTTLTTKLVGFWSNSGWTFYFMACFFGELGYPGMANIASLVFVGASVRVCVRV